MEKKRKRKTIVLGPVKESPLFAKKTAEQAAGQAYMVAGKKKTAATASSPDNPTEVAKEAAESIKKLAAKQKEALSAAQKAAEAAKKK